MLDCTIVCSTFGDYQWMTLAHERALPSASSFGVPVIYNHGDTLHGTRNLGLAQVQTEYVCHLDADDELDKNFFKEIEKIEGDIRVPAIQYMPHRSPFIPNISGHTSHKCIAECLEFDNWIVVGAVAKTDMLIQVGGWRDYPAFEDWDLWQRCWLAGAIISPAPKAIYKAYSTAAGRNRVLSPLQAQLIKNQIRSTNTGKLT